MGRLATARDNHIARWVLPTASRLLIEAACRDAPVRSLAEVAQIEMGQSPSGESCNQDGDGVLLIGGPADLGLKYPDATRWTSQPTKLCREGDIIVCVRATIGEPRWADGGYCLGRGVAGLRPSGSDLDSRFLFRIIEGNEDWLRSQGTGTTFKTISKVHLARIKVPIIPKKEQQQISSFLEWLENNSGNRPDFSSAPPLPSRLSEQRRIVAKIEALAAKIEEVKGIRQDAIQYSDVVVNAALQQIKETALAKNSSPIASCSNMSTGTTPPSKRSDYFGGGINWYTPGDLSFDKRLKPASRTIDEKAVQDGKARIFEPDTILLVGIGGSLGKVALSHERCSANQQITGIKFSPEILPEYGFWWMRALYNQLRAAAPQATLPIINQRRIGEFPIAVLPKEEQHRIVAYLDGLQAQVDALKKLQAQTAAELDALLPAILDRAFKGEL